MSADKSNKFYTLAEGDSFVRADRRVMLTKIEIGCPFASDSTAVLIRNRPDTGGLGLLQDTQLIETLAHFNRERIPERYEQ